MILDRIARGDIIAFAHGDIVAFAQGRIVAFACCDIVAFESTLSSSAPCHGLGGEPVRCLHADSLSMIFDRIARGDIVAFAHGDIVHRCRKSKTYQLLPGFQT